MTVPYGSMPVSYAELIDPTPKKLKVEVQSKNSPNIVTDKAGNSSFYTYDKWRNITSFTDALGNTTKQTYNQ